MRLEVLEGELPTVATKPTRRRHEPTEEEFSARAAEKARLEHSSILAAARRQRAGKTKRAPTPTPSGTIANAVYRDPTDSGRKFQILHVSRWNKLRDIVTLIRHRQATDADWPTVPSGSRRGTVKCLAGLLGHFVPASDLEAAVRTYSVEFCGAAWTADEWDGEHRIEDYLTKAIAAEAAEAQGLDGTSLRETPYIARITDLLDVRKEEQISLELRALRTNAVRKKLERKARGGLFREELNAKLAETSVEAARPWEALNVGRRTYYSRLAAAKKASAQIVVADVVETAPTAVIEPPAQVAPAPGATRPSLGRLFPGLMVRHQAAHNYDPETGEILGALAKSAA